MSVRPVRVMYVEKPPFVGGTVTGLYDLVRSLDRERFDPVLLFHGPNAFRHRFQELGLEVITLSETMPTQPQGLPKRDVAMSLGRYSRHLADAYRNAKEVYRFLKDEWALAHRVKRIVLDREIDLVHHNNTLNQNRATVLAAKLAGVPQICHARMLHKFSIVEHFMGRWVDAFVYMSHAIERINLDQGIPANRGFVVYDGFDVARYDGQNRNQVLRSEFGIGPEELVITNVGRIDHWKGQDFFLEAIAKIRHSHPGVRAVIIGEPDNTPLVQAYWAKIKKLVDELKLKDCVIFTGFRDDIPEMIAGSDVIVHSSSEPEPFGRVIVEAMLGGRPVIATGAGGVLDIVADEETGLLVPLRDSDAMATALDRLLANPEWAHSIGMKAKKVARERFSSERNARDMEAIYTKVLAARSAGSPPVPRGPGEASKAS